MPTEDDSCNICEGDRSTSKNPIIFCDGKDCNLPVHKRCYHVLSIPKGEWYCERCECTRKNKTVNIVCCSTETGAIKRTNLTGEYMHVVCALWNKMIKHEKEPYSIPEAHIGTHECYFCSQKQGLCIKCEHSNCSTYFHVTCAINNGLITPAPTCPVQFSPRCGQHQLKSDTSGKKIKRRLRPSRVMSDTESDISEETSSEEEERPIPKDQKSDEESDDDDMGTKKIPVKRRVSPDLDPKMQESFSYKDRLEAKRKKSGLENKSMVMTPPLQPPPPPPLQPPKQKLPNKAHLNVNRQPTPPIKKMKDLDEIQNDIRNIQRWNNNNNTPLQHPQPTTPNTVNTLFFENEMNKGGRKSSDSWKSMNGNEELNRLREESRKFDQFKRVVTEVFQGLNVPVQGIDPTQDVELYVTQLQLLLKRVGPIREEERVQIDELVKESMKK